MKKVMKILIAALVVVACPLIATSAFATWFSGKNTIVEVLSEPYTILFVGMTLIGIAGFGKKIRTIR